MSPASAPLTPEAPMQVPAPSVDYQGQIGNGFEVGYGVNIQPNNNIVAEHTTSVVVASQANVNLASELENGDTVDGVVLATGNLVLVKAQTDPKENGVYVVPASGAASRSTDFGAYGLTYHRKPVKVLGGTDAGKVFLQATRGIIIIATTEITFEQYVGQLEHQAVILDATKEAMKRQNVRPNTSVPHLRWTDGILSYDNQQLLDFFAKDNVRVASAGLVVLSGLQTIDGVVLAAGDRVLVKNGGFASANYTACRCSSIGANIDLANDLENGDTLDGLTLATNDRVLIKDQTATEENGIYIVQAAGAAVRATDMDLVGEVILGKGVSVTAGTNAGKTYLVSAVPTTLGTDPLLFEDSAVSTIDDQLNGIYVVGSGAWARSTDASQDSATGDIDKRVAYGMTVFVKEGTVNGEKSFFLKTANPITVNTTPLAFENLDEVITKNFTNQPQDTIQNVAEAGAYRSL